MVTGLLILFQEEGKEKEKDLYHVASVSEIRRGSDVKILGSKDMSASR